MARLSQSLIKGDYITDERDLFEVASVGEISSFCNVVTKRYTTLSSAELDRIHNDKALWRQVFPEEKP